MRVLIVEDDPNKRRQLRQAVEATAQGVAVREATSYRSGMVALAEWCPDIVLLDMTLPTFDVTATDSGGRTRIFGGRDVLLEMQRNGLKARVFLVTQFESFGEGSKRRTLKELGEELASTFPDVFRGTIYYHPAQSDWKVEVDRALRGGTQ